MSSVENMGINLIYISRLEWMDEYIFNGIINTVNRYYVGIEPILARDSRLFCRVHVRAPSFPQDLT